YKVFTRRQQTGLTMVYFVTIPVVAFTKAAYPDFVFPQSMYQTGAGKRDAAPREKAGGLSGCFFTQPCAFSYATLYAASESIANSVIWNGLLLAVAPLQDSAPPALTPLWMLVP